MATTTATKTAPTLSRTTRSGSYSYRIFFDVLENEMVRITERMHDSLMGDWIGRSRDRVITRDEARAYWKECRANGMEAN